MRTAIAKWRILPNSLRFLASDEASFITAEDIAVDGGITSLGGWANVAQWKGLKKISLRRSFQKHVWFFALNSFNFVGFLPGRGKWQWGSGVMLAGQCGIPFGSKTKTYKDVGTEELACQDEDEFWPYFVRKQSMNTPHAEDKHS